MADKPTDSLTGIVWQLVKDCESYREELAKERTKAMEYFDGEMTDVPVTSGRSKVVSRDVRTNIKKVLPSMVRTILGNDRVVEYAPTGPHDEEGAEQATDYVNYIVFPESDGYDAVQDAIHDALLLRNGIIRWWYDNKICVSVSSHTGLDEMAMVQLVSGDDVTVLEQQQTVQVVDTPQGPQPQTFYDVKIRRRTTQGRTRLAAVPPEQLLIHPDALDIEESPLTGVNYRIKRSDLVAMGHDRDLVAKLPVATGTAMDDQGDEELTRRRDIPDIDNQASTAAKAMQEVEYYELYARIDADDDGIAELRRIVYGGAVKEEYKLSDEEWDDVPFADIISERRPHQREGESVTDDTMDVQKIKTVLLRQTLDNLYWQNMPQPIVQEEAIVEPEAVLNPQFGKPIRVRAGVDVNSALGYTKVPFVAKESFSMLEYMDREATDRTGISDASSGLAPDALQNMTAKASAMVEQAGIGQTELMARTISRGLRRVFQGLLKLIIKHQDKPRTVRLRDEWVTFDPRQWNADMDVTVNTGLGAGTRERDMMMMQMITGLQEKLMASLGAMDNPFVTPENVYNALSRLVEAAGLRSVDLYFTKPDPEAIKRRQDAAASAPDPELEKTKLQMQAQAQKATFDAQLAKQKQEADIQLEMSRLSQEMELKRYQIDQEIMLKRQQNAAQLLTREPVTDAHIGGMPG